MNWLAGTGWCTRLTTADNLNNKLVTTDMNSETIDRMLANGDLPSGEQLPDGPRSDCVDQYLVVKDGKRSLWTWDTRRDVLTGEWTGEWRLRWTQERNVTGEPKLYRVHGKPWE